MTLVTFQVLAVLFLATLIRSASGFGEALVAVPLLALLMPIEVAAPVAVLTSITVAAVVLVQDWSEVHVRSAGWLVLSTLFGIPLGLLLLTRVAEPVVKTVLAVGDLRHTPRVVAPTLPGDVAGLFPTGQPGGHGRLLVRGAVDCHRDSLLPGVATGDRARDLRRPLHQPAHARSTFSTLHPFGPRPDRSSVTDAGSLRIDHTLGTIRMCIVAIPDRSHIAV